MSKKCDGSGILWLDHERAESIEVCPGCKTCREAARQSLKDSNSKPLSKREIRVLKKGGLDCEVTFRGLMSLNRAVNRRSVDLLRKCLTLRGAMNLLALTKDEVVGRLESDPPKLLGFEFQSLWLLPRVQFHRGQLIPNFERVLAAFSKPLPDALGISTWFGGADCDLEIGGKALSPRE